MGTTDRTKSLLQLEGDIWGSDEPTEEDDENYKSGLARRCEALRGTPLMEYSPGDLRVMIGQNESLPYLVPLALDVLSRDLLVEGDYYPGDLLEAVLNCGKTRPYARFWEDNLSLKARLEEMVGRPRNDPRVKEFAQTYWASSGRTVAAPAPARRRGRKRKA